MSEQRPPYVVDRNELDALSELSDASAAAVLRNVFMVAQASPHERTAQAIFHQVQVHLDFQKREARR